MSKSDRAKQFIPFDALKGLQEALREKEIEYTQKIDLAEEEIEKISEKLQSLEIGDNVTLAPRVHILAHDASTKIPLGYTKIGRVTIGSNVFIGAGSIIMPNVKIGDNVIIGAMSLVTRDIPSGGVYAGNPCARISDYDEWVAKHHDRMNKSKVYDKTYTIGTISDDQKQNMKRELEWRIGYVE